MLSHDCHLEKEIKDWLGYLKMEEDGQLLESLRRNSRSGRPCDDEAFAGKIEKIVGRSLRALPWGRPRKEKK